MSFSPSLRRCWLLNLRKISLKDYLSDFHYAATQLLICSAAYLLKHIIAIVELILRLFQVFIVLLDRDQATDPIEQYRFL